MERALRVFALIACVAATGCASVAGGNTQKMYVQAQAQDGTPVTGADCALSNDKGTWRIKSPGDTSITRSNKRMEVKCEKSPLPQGVVSVESSTRGAMFGNIIIGGVVGAVIDHSSGAGYEYPEVVSVVMGRFSSMDLPKGASPAATAEAMKVARTRQDNAAAQGAAAPMAASAPQPAPIASGYARIDDVDAVPYLSDKGRENYREWLTRPTPKAYAISTGGQWFGAWSMKPGDPAHPIDPSERALYVCQQRAKAACELYAVNGSVVWVKPVSAAAPAPVVTSVATVTPVAPTGESALVRPVSYTPVASDAPRPALAGARGHARVVPAASGYAAADNADAVPVHAEGKQRYTRYLALPSPKAFVVYETGGWRFWANSADAMTTLLDGCAREGRKCWLYAVDDQVVWREDVAQRVGRSDQLGR